MTQPPTTESIVQVNVRIPAELRKRVRVKAAQEETTLQAVIVGLLAAWVQGTATPAPENPG